MSSSQRLVSEIEGLRHRIQFLESLEFQSRRSVLGSAISSVNTFLCVPGIRAVFPNFNLNITNIDGNNLSLAGTSLTPVLTQNGFSSYANLDTSDNQAFTSTSANFNRENLVGTYMQNPGVSIGSWIRLGSLLSSGARGIIGQWNPSTNDKSYALWMDSNENISGSVSSDGTTNQVALETDIALTTAQWYFVAMVWVPSTSVKVFVYDPSVNSLDTQTNTTSISATLHQASPVSWLWGGRYAAGGSIQGWDGDLAWGFMSVAALSDSWIDMIYQTTRGSLGQ